MASTIRIHRLLQSKQLIAGLVIVLFDVAVALLAPVIATHDVGAMDYSATFAHPGQAHHLLGTDDFGRDILSRLIFGTRISLMVGIIAVSIGAIAGTLIGVLSGYFGGFLDAVIMRIMDALFSFPYVLLAIAMMAVLGPGLVNAMIAIGVVMVPSFARVVRSATLGVKHEEFIVSARAIGGRHGWIVLNHILPNIVPTIIIYSSLNFAGAVISEATLSFLGLGIQPPTPSWGSMLSQASPFLRQAPHMAVFPGLAILVTCLGFNLLGDGLRDVLDPRLRK